MVKSAGKYARCAGVSLVECLVASALALSLLTGIVMVAAELIATTRAMERRSDQVTRAGQLLTFLKGWWRAQGYRRSGPSRQGHRYS